MKIKITLLFLFFSLIISAQNENIQTAAIVLPMILPTPIYTLYRPVFTDFTLYFFNDTLIWNCHMTKNPIGYYTPLYDVDFRLVDTCKCYLQILQRTKKTIYGNYLITQIRNKEYGTFVKISDENYKYTALNSEGNIIKTDTINFKINEVLSTDSLYFEEFGQESLKVLNYFKTN